MKKRKVYRKGNRYIINNNGKVKIVTKKKLTLNNASNKRKVSLETNITSEVQNCIENSVNQQPTVVNKPKIKRKHIILVIALFVALSVVSIFLGIFVVPIPSGLKLSGEVLSWNRVNRANYYILDIDGEEFITESTSFNVADLLPKSHKAKVRAVQSDSQKSIYSKSYDFIIPKQKIKISAAENASIIKTYDGNSDYSGSLNLGEHYYINKEDLKYGDNVDIVISKIKFNSSDVWTAERAEVSYSALLRGSDANNYSIEAGTFEINAKILPKHLKVSPKLLTKQFADSDNLTSTIKDEEIGQSVSVSYTRTAGESIGTYDITGVTTSNQNYILNLNESSCFGAFEIVPRIINVCSEEKALISKIYDGTTKVDISDFNSYLIENTLSGYPVDIELTSAYFDTENVSSANKVNVEFNVLNDPNDVYRISKSSFEVKGQILPKPVEIIPNNFSKEFGNNDDIVQTYTDSDTNQTVKMNFERVLGENIGVYDIISVSSLSANYNFRLLEDSGKNKFRIEKRTIQIIPLDICLKKTYDGNFVYAEEICKNQHYALDGELIDYNVDLTILNAYFNSYNVNEATKVIVEVDKQLNDINGIYRISQSSFELPAKINRKSIVVEPNSFSKQYGDRDNLNAEYADDELSSYVNFSYVRTLGESVGVFDIISATSKDDNYEFKPVNGSNKFSITKREIGLETTDEVAIKVFDNTDICDFDIEQDKNYRFSNLTGEDIPTISFSARFLSSKVSSNGILLENINLESLSDRYVLNIKDFVVRAQIIPKPIMVEPQYYSFQFGDTEYMRQTYTDEDLGFTFDITFIREAGEDVGVYDIDSAVADNHNYEVVIVNGAGKFQLGPRLLGVEKGINSTFSKVYDGTRACNVPITLGLHYNLTNLNGGTNASLNIISKEYNSADVADATKVIVRYSAILDGEEADQYVTVGGTMEFDAVITPRNIEVVPDTFNKDYLYEFTATQNILEPLTGELIPVTFDSTAKDVNCECGVYDITSVNWTDTNHTFTISEGTGVGKFIINRIYLPISCTDRNTVYNAQSQGINTPQSYPERELEIVYKLSSATDEEFAGDLPVNAGTYTARIKFEGDKNYLPTYIDRTLYIERAQSIIVNTTPDNYIYDGTIRPLTATLNHSEAEIAFSRNNYINAGTYNYILISVPQTQNYKAASIVVSLNIAKKIIRNDDIIYPAAGAITYGQYLYSSALTGGSTLGEFAWDNPSIKPVVADTQFIVNFTPYDFDNYDWADVEMQRTVDITVNRFVVTELNYPKASGVIHTNALSTSTLSGTSPYGEFTWEDENIVPTESGYFNVEFTPYDVDNFDYSNIELIKEVYVVVSFRTYFNSNGGSNVAYMITSEILAEPFTYREGYIFEGWYYDDTLMFKVEFPLAITQETVLYAGWYSEGLIFLERNGYYSVKLDASTIEREIFIPSEYKGLPVTTIENNGFRNCTSLEVVVIPQSVKSIGHYAFVGCVNLAFVQIMGNNEEINFGISWADTSFEHGTDISFNSEKCTECDGTVDFHQPSCELYEEY